MVGVEHRHVLERGERAVLVALLAQHAGLLPEELLDLGRIVGRVEPSRNDREKLLVVLALANATEELVEGDRAPGVACEARLEGMLALRLVSEIEQEQRGLLPERGPALGVMAAGPELGGCPGAQRGVADLLGAGPEPLPRREIRGARGRGLLEDGRRGRRVACGEP